ncbi:MAG: GcrA family cell cycle regulator [Alphaproteobacteria bacterium]|nr:GcrA family cell cycle regulator [Alphaproteobacteria bacterium]
MAWTDKQIAKMKALYAKGLSMSEIGAKLGMSKNQVVGKINRLGLNSPVPLPAKKSANKPVVATKKVPVKAVVKPVAKAAVKVKVPVKKAPTKAEIKAIKAAEAARAEKKKKDKAEAKKTSKRIQERNVNHALALAELSHDQCRWPIGSTSSDDFHFCGKKVFVGKPYCFEHCKMSYAMQAPAPKEKK